MFSRIMSVLMCIISVFTAMFSQFVSETTVKIELKNELAKGNYESPYIVRPLEDITVNGVSINIKE